MARKYYTLATRMTLHSDWEIEFGDYDRKVVEDEKGSLIDDGYDAKNLKVIATNDDKQASIVAAVKKLNTA